MILPDPSLKYLPAPDPERYLPWKVRQAGDDFRRDVERMLAELDAAFPDDLDEAPDLSLYEYPPSVTIELTPMSRKYDRSKKVKEAAHFLTLETLKASLRKKPWYIPGFLWWPVFWIASKIVFK